jgi:hypothetical protein
MNPVQQRRRFKSQRLDLIENGSKMLGGPGEPVQFTRGYEVGPQNEGTRPVGVSRRPLLDTPLKFLNPGQITVRFVMQELVIAGDCLAKLRHSGLSLEIQYGTATTIYVLVRGLSGRRFAKLAVTDMQLPFRTVRRKFSRALAKENGWFRLMFASRKSLLLRGVDGAHLLPMHSLPADLQRFEDLANDARLVILGHQGVRSLQVVSWLGLQRLENCFSLAGGTTGGVARLTRLYRTTEPSERR